MNDSFQETHVRDIKVRLLLQSMESLIQLDEDEVFEVSVTSLKHIQQEVTSEFGLDHIGLSCYNWEGFQLYEDDFHYLKTGDLIYICQSNLPFPVPKYLSEFNILNKIGKGSFGSVYLGEHKILHTQRAIKCINCRSIDGSKTSTMMAYKEANNLQKLKHPNIIKIFNVFHYKELIIMFMEFVSGGELTNYILKKGGSLTEGDAKVIFAQLIDAINYCHGHKIVHRDIKLQNILLTETRPPTIKVIDFGISGIFEEKSKSGTVRYSPPELVSGDILETDPRIDVWALGVILYRCVFGIFPFKGDSAKDYIRSILSDVIFLDSSKVSEECKDLICDLLKKDPMERIQMYQVYKHDWIKSRQLPENSSITEEIVSEKASISTYNTHTTENEEFHTINELTEIEMGEDTEEKVQVAPPESKKGGFLSLAQTQKCPITTTSSICDLKDILIFPTGVSPKNTGRNRQMVYKCSRTLNNRIRAISNVDLGKKISQGLLYPKPETLKSTELIRNPKVKKGRKTVRLHIDLNELKKTERIDELRGQPTQSVPDSPTSYSPSYPSSAKLKKPPRHHKLLRKKFSLKLQSSEAGSLSLQNTPEIRPQNEEFKYLENKTFQPKKNYSPETNTEGYHFGADIISSSAVGSMESIPSISHHSGTKCKTHRPEIRKGELSPLPVIGENRKSQSPNVDVKYERAKHMKKRSSVHARGNLIQHILPLGNLRAGGIPNLKHVQGFPDIYDARRTNSNSPMKNKHKYLRKLSSLQMVEISSLASFTKS